MKKKKLSLLLTASVFTSLVLGNPAMAVNNAISVTSSITSYYHNLNVAYGYPPSSVFQPAFESYIGSNYTSIEFCDNAIYRPLIEAIPLNITATASSVVSKRSLVAGYNLCSSSAAFLTSDNIDLYYIRNGSAIEKVPINATSPTIPTRIVNERATSLAQDASHLYWTVGNQLRKRSKLGGTVQTIYQAPANQSIQILTKDSTHLFVGETIDAVQTFKRLRKIPLVGGTSTVLYTQNTQWYESTRILNVAQDVQNIYWIETYPVANVREYRIRSASKTTGSNLLTLRTSRLPLGNLTKTLNKLYWTEAASNNTYMYSRNNSGYLTYEYFINGFVTSLNPTRDKYWVRNSLGVFQAVSKDRLYFLNTGYNTSGSLRIIRADQQ